MLQILENLSKDELISLVNELWANIQYLVEVQKSKEEIIKLYKDLVR